MWICMNMWRSFKYIDAFAYVVACTCVCMFLYTFVHVHKWICLSSQDCPLRGREQSGSLGQRAASCVRSTWKNEVLGG